MQASESPIRVMTVDDHPILRDGIAGVIEGESDMVLVGEASNGRDAIEAFRRLRPDITLMDVQMPEMDGVDAIKGIRSEFPTAKIIVLTTFKGDAQALQAMRAGAQAYLLKSSLRKELLETIRVVMAGRKRIPPEIAAQIAEYASMDALSPREIEILKGVAAGNANKAIATLLNISEETVKTHMKRILEKLDAKDRTHAVTIALKRGIFSL